MRITENDLRYMITESIQKILSEGISKITYHFTSLESCINILKKNEIFLTMSSNRADATDNKRLFYLSTQRSRNKDIGYAGHLGSCVRIQIDGDKLSNNYTGKPLDYWGASMGKQSYYSKASDSIYGSGLNNARRTHHNFEMEDRIVSYEPSIKDFTKYISRIDVFINPWTERLQQTKVQKYIDEIEEKIMKDKQLSTAIYVLGNRYKVPTNIYISLKDFNSMTNNTINDEIYELYQNSYDYKNESDYRDSETYKASQYLRNETTKINVLRELFNVLTLGKIYRMENKGKFISETLKKFGLEKYVKDVLKEFKGRWGNSYTESCNLLSNTINAPIRKLNYEIDDEDSLKIMKFGSNILRKFGVSNFNDLPKKVENQY